MMTVSSIQYTGRVELPHDKDRTELMVFEESGETTIALGNGGSAMDIQGYFETLKVPLSEVVIETTGSFVLLTDARTHRQAGGIQEVEYWYNNQTYQIYENKQIPEGVQIDEL